MKPDYKSVLAMDLFCAINSLISGANRSLAYCKCEHGDRAWWRDLAKEEIQRIRRLQAKFPAGIPFPPIAPHELVRGLEIKRAYRAAAEKRQRTGEVSHETKQADWVARRACVIGRAA